MKPTVGYEATQAMDGSGFPTLPAGGYICEIKGAQEGTTRNGAQMLVLMIDIAEGEQKGFYSKQYNADRAKGRDAKWRGMFYQLTTDREELTSGFFKGLITAIERSNPGYKWDWDESKLKGKKVGFVFREEEYLNQRGEVRTSVKATWPRDVEAIRQGVEVPEIKRLANAPPAPSASFAPGGTGFVEVEDDSLPF